MKRAVSFNGGKESLVILYQNLLDIQEGKTLVFRIKEENEFSEIEEYIGKIKGKYGINVIEFLDVKESIEILKKDYNVEIVVLGVRKSDPKGETYSVYQPTDNGWDMIMRYHPLLDWSYADVWNYIDFYSLPVCSLYEKGYTSLGVKNNTFPNYSLFVDGNYLHARELKDETLEREGRIKSKLPISFSGKVIHGKGMGKQLGFPTANLDVKMDIDEGVYYGSCILKDKEEKMVMSVGVNPTFGDKSVEVHILKKYEQDFYDEILSVNVKGFIRKMKKYDNLENLIKDINKDIQIANICY